MSTEHRAAPGRNLARKLLLMVPVVLVSLGAAACDGGSREEGSEEGAYRGRVLPDPIEKVDFTLTDTEGEPYDFARETEGKVALLFFGYTHCPDICPVHMANIAAVLRDLPYEVTDRIEVVFVTTDPERDTPERLASWLEGFHPSFVGLRGDPEEVNRIEQAHLLPPSFVETDEETGDVSVGHAAHVVAYTPDGKARVLYPFGTRQADWAHDLPLLVGEGSDGGSGGGQVVRAFVVVPPEGGRGAAYAVLRNDGGEADALLGLEAPGLASRAELHRSLDREGLMIMEAVDSLPLPAGRETRMEPGGHHGMLLELVAAPAPGDTVELRFRFRRAGLRRVRAPVVPYGELDARLGDGGTGEEGGG